MPIKLKFNFIRNFIKPFYFYIPKKENRSKGFLGIVLRILYFRMEITLENPFFYDVLNGLLFFKDWFVVQWVKRGGRKFVIYRNCIPQLTHPDCPHMRGFYIQLGKYGGDFMWKSKKCYQVK